MSAHAHGRRVVAALFAVWLLIGLRTCGDYGLSWDEPLMRDRVGRVNVDYLTGRDRAGLDDPSFRNDSYHGPALEIVAAGMEAVFRLEDSRAIYHARHGMLFGLYWLATICFYRICRRGFAGRPRALLATALLVLMPRVYADAFYNIKDAGFLACWILAIHCALRLARKPATGAACAAGAAAAFATDVRVIGLLLPAWFAVWGLASGGWLRAPGAGRRALAYGAAFTVTLLAFWPRLLHNPPLELLRALENNRNFPYNGTLLYLGRVVRAHDLPWHYLPVWIAISVPLVTLALALAGGLRALSAPRALTRPERAPLLAWLALSGVPVAMVILFRSPIYDGWRHFYFIAPMIAWLAAEGWSGIADGLAGGRAYRALRALLAAALLASLASTTVWMVRNHPLQNLYFNRFAGADAQTAKLRFEFDYYGLGYREAFTRLLARDSAPELAVAVANDAGAFAPRMLPPAERARVRLVDDYPSATYFIGNYRWNARGYFFRHIDLERIECVGVGNVCAVGVYRILPPGTLPPLGPNPLEPPRPPP